MRPLDQVDVDVFGEGQDEPQVVRKPDADAVEEDKRQWFLRPRHSRTWFCRSMEDALGVSVVLGAPRVSGDAQSRVRGEVNDRDDSVKDERTLHREHRVEGESRGGDGRGEAGREGPSGSVLHIVDDPGVVRRLGHAHALHVALVEESPATPHVEVVAFDFSDWNV